MPSISTALARAEFTKALMDVYRERPKVKGFLRSFFPDKSAATLSVSIEVRRGTEKVAVDVERGTEGNRNTMSRSSEKIYIPPLYKEYFDATQLELYDRLYGSTEISVSVYSQFLEELAESIGLLEDKIERAIELQASQVLQTGIVTMANGDNIDFKRKAAHIVDIGGSDANLYWSIANDSTCDPIGDLVAGANLLRQNGKAQGGIFDVILGGSALEALINMPHVQNRHDVRDYDLSKIDTPQMSAAGGVFHGVVSGGSYLFRLWTYPEYYEDPDTGSLTTYVDDTYFIMLPPMPRFHTAFAAVPQLLTDGQPPMVGPFVYTDFPDQRRKAHDFIVESAPICVPVAVDAIYTAQAVAS